MENATLNFDYETMNKEIRMIIVREARKSPAKMDMNLIRDGLDYLHPFNEQEDELRTRIAWNDFQSRYVSQYAYRLTHTRTVRKVIAITVLMVLLLATTICYALGVDLLSIVVNWTKEKLEVFITPITMVDKGQVETDAEYSDRVMAVWGNEVCEALTKRKLQVQLPSWKPNDFVMQGIEKVNTDDELFFLYAWYVSSDGKELIMAIQQYQDENELRMHQLEYEADGAVQEVLCIAGCQYYVLSNLEDYSVTWNNNLHGIFISGDISYDEALQMIQSMNE